MRTENSMGSGQSLNIHSLVSIFGVHIKHNTTGVNGKINSCLFYFITFLLFFSTGDQSHLLHSNVSTGKTRSRINEMLGHSVVSNMGLNQTTLSTVAHKKVKSGETLAFVTPA